MKLKYYDINRYREYLDDLKRRKLTFEVQSTNYTRKIKRAGMTAIFNADGFQDHKVLKLINYVRQDAKEYLKRNVELNDKGNINYFQLLSMPQREEIVCKVDLRQAYWEYAMKQGVLTERTNAALFDQYKDEDTKELKAGRLKALGSLATTKKISYYFEGKRMLFKNEFGVETYDKIKVEPTKELYIDINRGVDYLMRECAANVPECRYYYWDCMFISQKFAPEAVDFFRDYKYKVKVEEVKLKAQKIGNFYYLIGTDGKSSKAYMVRREDKYLLEENNLY